MSECTCHKNYTLDTLIPKVGVITDIRQETPDVKTFRVNAPEGGKLFEHMPGQCAMVCAPGVSEGMAIPQPHAGGSWATNCWQRFNDPVLVEEVRAAAPRCAARTAAAATWQCWHGGRKAAPPA